MNNQLDINEIRKIEIDILKHFDSFCKKHNIRYYLSNGTLLGAVKYQGFIPWDDDIDVVMLREDYEKFIREYVDSQYVLFEAHRNKMFLYPFAKLSDSNTILLEENTDNGVELGINIDIFPLDYVGTNNKRARKMAVVLHYLSILLIYAKRKVKFISTKRIRDNIINLFVTLLAKCFKADRYIRVIWLLAHKYSDDIHSQYIASLCWSVYKEKEVHSVNIFSNSIDIEFEGKLYPAPSGYDEYLRNLYGDYQQDPPIERRVSHHNFKAYRK